MTKLYPKPSFYDIINRVKKSKIKVYVLAGGPSAEHEVSLATAKKVIEALDDRQFDVKPILISRRGRWLIPDGSSRRLLTAANPKKRAVGKPSRTFTKPDPNPRHIAFIAMHGSYGEDGTLQGMLELAGMPYTGSGVLASALAMDKVKSGEILRSHGILIPKFIAFEKSDWNRHRNAVKKQISKLGYPLVIKPRDRGSSVGVSIVKSAAGLNAAARIAFKHSGRVMAQQYIRGREVTCAVIDRGMPATELPLQPTEIIPKSSSFFDYRAKYTPGASQEITPPNLPKPLIKKIQQTALACHRALGCSGMSRTDMILTAAGDGANPKSEIRNQKSEIRNPKSEIRDPRSEIRNPKSEIRNPRLYVLEVNTIPGMTETSLLPQAAKACGIEFPELLERIIEAGFNRFRRH